MILTYYCIITMIIIAYLLGSIPRAVCRGKKYYGIDIRQHGSKHAGTTNMLRVLGRRAALPVFLLDFLKGFVAVTLTEILKYDAYINDMWLINIKIIAVFAAVLGHIFPIFAGFRGGKGVAVTCAWLMLYLPVTGVLCCLAGGVAVLLTGYLPVGAVLIAALAVPVGWLQYGTEAGAVLALNAVIMVTRHWAGGYIAARSCSSSARNSDIIYHTTPCPGMQCSLGFYATALYFTEAEKIGKKYQKKC